MADDLEAFLRQAAQRRAARKQSVTPRPAPTKPARAKPSATRQHTPDTSVHQRRPKEPVVEAEVVAEPLDRLETHVDTSDISRHAQQLGSEVEQADDRIEARLDTDFDHDLGSFGDDNQAAQIENIGLEDVATPGSEIAEMLTNPTSLRNAIVLNEIFSPLKDRW